MVSAQSLLIILLVVPKYSKEDDSGTGVLLLNRIGVDCCGRTDYSVGCYIYYLIDPC